MNKEQSDRLSKETKLKEIELEIEQKNDEIEDLRKEIGRKNEQLFKAITNINKKNQIINELNRTNVSSQMNNDILLNDYQNNKLQRKFFKDILFINGCTLDHPFRYRVLHQIEQLHFNGYSCDCVFYEDLDLQMVKYYRGFIFYRCPHTKNVEEFIIKCKYYNKVTFFDIDDLVIDFKYVNQIKYIHTMNEKDYDLYMDGVNRMQQTMKLCDHAITTTETLKEELCEYVNGEIFINRNVSSDYMAYLALEALKTKVPDNNKIIIGYFSGSITHNDDFQMILPIIKRVLSEYKNLYIKIVGILDVPDELENYKEQIIIEEFHHWQELPKIISAVDINICPLENTIFNRAKSENKWVEAAFVKTPTIASNVGAFNTCIQHGVDGLLCNDNDDWYLNLKLLIDDDRKRNSIAENACHRVRKNNVTSYTGLSLLKFIESNLNPNILFVLPSTNISGGVNVTIKHCSILRDHGYDVTIINNDKSDENIKNKDGEVNVVSSLNTTFQAFFHKLVATLWNTLDFVNIYPKVKKKYYLVQNFETDFYAHGQSTKIYANRTYNSFNNLKYLTISKWCSSWLYEKYKKQSKYVPNGIDLAIFKYKKRNFKEKKIKILIEGNSEDNGKNVDESFKISNQLDRDKYEIWYLSYKGKPKDWYMVDKLFHQIPNDEVYKIYQECHLLIKSSILESFSYPPLEMMATGGIVLVAPNEGNKEYLKDRENCLMYNQGDINMAISLIEEVISDESLRGKLICSGLETSKGREWNCMKDRIVELYD
ncbi:glycosyltransferase [Chengkuizengella sediminis]|uniref:glycosyltransferase n=1 Tax=Chengkuizengella sediminis TaxID=1885917 RepID=UPI00138958A5|nr:glycosyltransferase [Chengkuizengella sediminis]NDI36231.1 glycosyltransferase [Chengkuizengella sediminis]